MVIGAMGGEWRRRGVVRLGLGEWYCWGEYGGVVWGGLVRGLRGGGEGECMDGCVLAESRGVWVGRWCWVLDIEHYPCLR